MAVIARIAFTLLFAAVETVADGTARGARIVRRDTFGQGIEVDRQAATLQQVDGHRWQPEEPSDVTKDMLGGSAAENVFLGEDRFLQDISDHTRKVEEQKVQHVAFAEAAAVAGFVNLAAIGGNQPIALDLDAAAFDRQKKLKVENMVENVKHKEDIKQSIFSAEQPFLKAVSADTPLAIRWEAHPEKCLCGQPPNLVAEPPRVNTTLVIWDCNDVAKGPQMKFLLPTGEFGHGQIKWAHDQSKCLYVFHGFEGNGNTVYLGDCDDTPNMQNMNFSVDTPGTGSARPSGRSAIEWAKQSGEQPTHCLDVKDMQKENGTPLELWDCASGTNWEIY